MFNSLSQSLNNAKENIIIVTAWFTDQQLLDILVEKQKDGIPVSVVIGDNKDNEKLDFNELLKLGGMITKIKGKGYGMKHQKYCIIDNDTGFDGSYNWTVNTRKNNSESVIKTNHKLMIENLLNDLDTKFI
ncbi:phospholipase D-like domain-containing protein [Wenyingzhuangia sp. chi5]|uniref:phospholipase D n=1 Tax=Wenyingzhuangia gilva TaxID=3057677 RepID=A0ABT8VRY8_9FLAO|nr:phospholipase D-like domain-containing protein [Wenyingzhuangia sp. chi5]MDO3694732.1 phospholipase D-like domain-containing protein [Wenyingzhuangia sp. chi5]